MTKEVRYFNFPIQLLQNFIKDSNSSLRNIFSYCLYEHTLKYTFQDEIPMQMQAAARYFRVRIGDVNATYKLGEELYNSIPKKSPHAGINLTIFWDFHDNHKSDFEKACLLAFLAMKSIIGKKKYCHITNAFILSRMDGKVKSCNFENISIELQKFGKEYQFNKIKRTLEIKWYLVSYGYHMRGFYITFELSIEELIYIAETNRDKAKVKVLQNQKKIALEKVRERIRLSGDSSRPI